MDDVCLCVYVHMRNPGGSKAYIFVKQKYTLVKIS